MSEIKYKLLRIYECNGCCKKVSAGSKELLEEWTKGGTINYNTGENSRWYRCGACSD